MSSRGRFHQPLLANEVTFLSLNLQLDVPHYVGGERFDADGVACSVLDDFEGEFALRQSTSSAGEEQNVGWQILGQTSIEMQQDIGDMLVRARLITPEAKARTNGVDHFLLIPSTPILL